MVELTPGLELGARFVLMRRLGRGGSAEVWLADDRERGKSVALKIVDSEKWPNPIAGDGMETLPMSAAEIGGVPVPVSREFIVPVDDVVRLDDRTLLVMEFLPGGDLGQFRGRSFDQWGRHADEIAAALEALHAANLVHRDLKCSNVLIDAAGRARLSDFALTVEAGTRTADGGSPYNASPQQLRGEPAAAVDDLYAFGALLYELIAGHPPYYPEITRDRVLHEPLPPLVARGIVPVGVRELALRLLAKSPRERPASAGEVRAQLAAAVAEESGAAELESVLPVEAPQARSRGSRLLPIALSLAAVLAVAAIIWLPKYLVPESSGISEEARAEAKRQASEQKSREQTAADRAAARKDAEASRTAFETAFKALDAQAAARWATADFAHARDAGARAADRFAAERFAEAASGWKEGSGVLATLAQQRDVALKDALQGGQKALAAGETADARKEFDLALAIEPANAVAKAGIERAGKLDQALAAVDAALAHERDGRPTAAEQDFRRALAIDAATPGAQEGLARLAARQSNAAYAAAMSRGFADLAAGRNDSARRSFQSALDLRPGSVEARDAIASLDQGQKAAALRLLESRARAAEGEERWDDALTAWREAAGLEASLQSARDGIERVTPRAELQRRIDALNREPQRLWEPSGRAEARNLLATAATAGNPRQRLAAAAKELERLAAAAQTPVKLRLQSDGVTRVAIYRVGQFGVFAERDVELLPGKYTVVGTRNGFRDVRREVVLPPGAPVSAIVVRCEEPI